MACGTDTLFIQEAIKKKCRIQLVLPFQKEFFEQDFDESSLKIFHSILSKYPHEIYLTIEHPNEKENSFLETGKSLAQKSDAILAIWDGLEGKGFGGTKDQIDYALQIGKELHWIRAERQNESSVNTMELNPDVNAIFNKEDQLAVLYKDKYHTMWTGGILFGLTAIFSFEFNFGFIQGPIAHLLITLFGFISLFIAFKMLTYNANKLKNLFVRHRRNAETLRAEIWKNNLKYSSIPQSLRDKQHVFERVFFQNKKRDLWMYLFDQVNYQKTRRIGRFTKNVSFVENVLKGIRIVVMSLFILLALYYIIGIFSNNYFLKYSLIQDITGFLWMSAPPIYAALEGVLHFNEWKKNLKTSTLVIDKYIELQEQILSCRELSMLLEIEFQIFETFTFEGKDWLTDQQSKKLELKI